MSENCFKCKKPLNGNGKDASETPTILSCGNNTCMKKYHRSCVNINDDAVFNAIQKNYVQYNCGECKDRYKILLHKIHSMEEKMNKLCVGVNQLQGRMLQQQQYATAANNMHYAPFAPTNGGNAKLLNNMNNNGNHNNNHNIMVVGCNASRDSKLNVVCDYGRWVQVGKFATQTTEEDIIDYIADELKLSKNLVKCTKLVKNDANLAQLSYCKFKISVPEYRFNDLFNETIWPNGVMVSPFTPRSQLNHNRN